jgi:lipoprotein-anchoring transpeptidase ErfK/SrfK
MKRVLSRRGVLLGGFALVAGMAQARADIDDFFDEDGNFIEPQEQPIPQQPGESRTRRQLNVDDPNFLEREAEAGERDPSLFPPPESPIDHPIQPANLRKVPKEFHRKIVGYNGPEWPGTIIVDPQNRHLYFIIERGKAIRYGVGVGRAGFEWQGRAIIGMKRRWPRWIPPMEMVARDKNARKWVNGQPGGPGNPLGARALYLYSDGVDTLYRIHGTNDPSSIGKAMSSGCIRMLDEDVADLYRRVLVGSKVVVLGSADPGVQNVSTY